MACQRMVCKRMVCQRMVCQRIVCQGMVCQRILFVYKLSDLIGGVLHYMQYSILYFICI